MSFFRRSLVRSDSSGGGGSFRRSSSLPPEAEAPTTVATTTGASRGRTANPIGTSRRSSQYDAAKNGGKNAGQRSQSLTRTGSSGGGGDAHLTRSTSFASAASASSAGSDIFEPGWFAHAFHGSGACTCGKEHEGRSCAEVWEESNKRGEDGDEAGDEDVNNDGGEKNDNDDNGHDDSYQSEIKTLDSHADATESIVTESTARESDSSNSKGSGGAGRSVETLSRGSEDGTLPPADSSSYDASTITSAAGGGSRGNTTATSFSARDHSIQSELLNNDDQSSALSYRPKQVSRSSRSMHAQLQNDNDMSSITMDFPNAKNPPPNAKQKSMGIVNKVKNKTIDKMKKKMRGNSFHEFEQSETSMNSRGRTTDRRSRTQSKVETFDDDDDDNLGGDSNPQDRRIERCDRRVRQRSRSIVRDARSLIDMIDKGGGVDAQHKRASNGGESVMTEESITSRSSTVIAGGGGARGSRQRDKTNGRNRGGSFADGPPDDPETTKMLSSLRETNDKHESTIRALQERLEDMTNERNALRNNSERMMDITTKQKSQLERELRDERESAADARESHRRDAEEWKARARRAERGRKEAEGRLASVSASNGVAASQDRRDLQRARQRTSEMEAEHESRLRRLRSDGEGHKSRANEWKEKHDGLERVHGDLLREREEEAAAVASLEDKLEGCRRVIEEMKEENESLASKAMVNDELVEKISELADENGRLVARCRKLERELATSDSLDASRQKLARDLERSRERNDEDSATMEALRVQNRKLWVTLANQGREANGRMRGLVRSLREGTAPTDDEDDEEGRYIEPIAEMEHEEALNVLRKMQAEGDALHKAMEEAVRQMAAERKQDDANEKNIANLVRKHESSAKEYDAKLERLREDQNKMQMQKDELSSQLEFLQKENSRFRTELEEANSLVVSSVRDEIEKEKLSKESLSWKREKRELSTSNESLKKENERLHGVLKEMNGLFATSEECAGKLSEENASLKDAQERQLQEMKVEREANRYLRKEVEDVSKEREEAYETCKVLQQEINHLRQSLKESKLRAERLGEDKPDNASASSAEVTRANESLASRLAKLTSAHSSLSRELEQKNQALQTVRSALETLKVEQGAIKKTIVELEAENAKLRNGGGGPSSSAPHSPKPPLRRQSSGSERDSSELAKLERRVRKCEKENKGLREANATLSAKLFDEMEKTDALRVANEGLAARICKLVAFIQQNPGNGGGEQAGGGSSTTSSRSGGGSKGRNKGPPPGQHSRKNKSFHR